MIDRTLFSAAVMVFAVAACSIAPSVGTPAPDFTRWLESYGQVFTPEAPPPDAPELHIALRDLPVPPGSQVASTIYGIVTCVNPTKNCANRGLARPGDHVAMWLVTFREDPNVTGCIRWAAFDPQTGQFIVGGGEQVCG